MSNLQKVTIHHLSKKKQKKKHVKSNHPYTRCQKKVATFNFVHLERELPCRNLFHSALLVDVKYTL